MSQLPIQAVMPELFAALACHSQVILKAAPGAGKSTYFPLQLLLEKQIKGKIIMLEPRRLAARNIAQYLAKQLGEKVGERVGYRMRGDSKVSAGTQLEIVTEGIMTRMLQADPELSGVDMLIFDEFHERSLHADTALALSLEVQEVFRPELQLVVMSATLDQHALSALMPTAAYVESQGRSFAVETRYQPLGVNDYLPATMAKTIESLLASEAGSILAFLPGVSAISQVAERLNAVPSDVKVVPLHGQLSLAEQQRAIAPAEQGQRKVVLATNIAETSLTIDGIRIVVDSGLERVARFDLKTGLTRLEQVRIAQSSAIQRAGRAGRLESGICVRLYSESQFNQQPAVPVADILQADLTNLMLELTHWGASEPNDLSWLDQPPSTAVLYARQLLKSLQLLNEDNALTEQGRVAHQLGCEPRIAAMLLRAQGKSSAAGDASWLNAALAAAALLEEPERRVLNIGHSLHRWQMGKHPKSNALTRRADHLALRCEHRFSLSEVDESTLALVLALAFPDRIAQRRAQQTGRFLLANGHGAQVREEEALADEAYLVALDLMRGQGNASDVYLAASLDLDALQQHFPQLFERHERVDWDVKRGCLTAQEQMRLGQLVIRTRELPTPGKEKMTQALLNFVQREGLATLQWSEAAQALRTRIACAKQWLPEEAWPSVDDAHLLADLETWLAPYLNGVTSLKQLQQLDLTAPLNAYLGWPLNQHIDEWLPTHYALPTGTRKAIRYQIDQEPVLSVRMQEMFGEQASPLIAKQRKALLLELLSPAQRPLQVTRDLAGFWAGSYKEVQKEMKGRYPKHVWPDDPGNHVATTKTKRQLNS